MNIAIGVHKITWKDASIDDEGTPLLTGSWVWRLWDGKSSISDPDSSRIGDENEDFTDKLQEKECEIIMELSSKGDLSFKMNEESVGTLCTLDRDEEGIRPTIIFTSLDGDDVVELLGGDCH